MNCKKALRGERNAREKEVVPVMRRIILVLAMVTLLSVMAAVPAIAQSGDDLSSWWGTDPKTCDVYWTFDGPEYWCYSYFQGWYQPFA